MPILIQSHWTSSGIAKKFNEIRLDENLHVTCKVKRNPVLRGTDLSRSRVGRSGYLFIYFSNIFSHSVRKSDSPNITLKSQKNLRLLRKKKKIKKKKKIEIGKMFSVIF